MAAYRQLISELMPGKPSLDVDALPSLAGKTALVTGANTGIGKKTCEILLNKGAKVYAAARSEEKATAAIEELKKTTGKTDIHFLKLDLADLTTIKGSAEDFLARESHLHLLFNNAGVMAPPKGSKTAQGHELQIGTNGFGHFLFTSLLMPTLLKTVEATKAESDRLGYNIVRVINTSSNGHLGAPKGGINWNDPNLAFNDPWGSYGESKFMNIAHSKGLAKRYGDKGLTSHSLNPGVIKTDLARHGSSIQNYILGFVMQPVDYGCLTQIHAGLSPETGKKEVNGSYYIPFARQGVVRSDANDPEVIEKIYNWMEEETSAFA